MLCVSGVPSICLIYRAKAGRSLRTDPFTLREYREGTTGRALPNGVTTAGGSAEMTVDLCLAACQADDYVLAGMEYAGECCKAFSFNR